MNFTVPSLPTKEELLRAKKELSYYRELIQSEGDDLKSSPATFPGRPRTFLLQPELKTAPFSCELIVYNNDLFEGLLRPVSRFLRCGAGVKIILDDYVQRKTSRLGFDWKFKLNNDHPDYHHLSAYQRMLEANKSFKPDYYIVVSDSMEKKEEESSDEFDRYYRTYSIEDSWKAMIDAAEKGEKVVVDLSLLRPHGQVNQKGLMASGPIGLGRSEKPDACSFFSIYETLAAYLHSPSLRNLLVLLGTINDTLRRGGFKRGIVTSGMLWSNKHFEEYLDVPLTKLPGGHKKGARLTEDLILREESLVNKISDKCNSESLFLAKVDEKSNAYDNVCMGLKIVNFGTCLIHRFNIGAVAEVKDIPGWMTRVATQLTLLHLNWRKEMPHISRLVAPQEQDLQIGLDIMGMANALAYWNISYKEFVHALGVANVFFKSEDNPIGKIDQPVGKIANADILAYYLSKGYEDSAKECDRICDIYGSPRFKRIHTPSEPAQSHSYETKDVSGYATARAIFAPPCSHFSNGCRIRRVSDHQKNVLANHGFIESAADIGPELHEELCAAFTKFVGVYGRSHGYMSFDDRRAMSPERLSDFVLNSDLKSKYYSEHENFDQYFLSKSAPTLNSIVLVSCGIKEDECAVCAE